MKTTDMRKYPTARQLEQLREWKREPQNDIFNVFEYAKKGTFELKVPTVIKNGRMQFKALHYKDIVRYARKGTVSIYGHLIEVLKLKRGEYKIEYSHRKIIIGG